MPPCTNPEVLKRRAAVRGQHYQFQLRVRQWKRPYGYHYRFEMRSGSCWWISYREWCFPHAGQPERRSTARLELTFYGGGRLRINSAVVTNNVLVRMISGRAGRHSVLVAWTTDLKSLLDHGMELAQCVACIDHNSAALDTTLFVQVADRLLTQHDRTRVLPGYHMLYYKPGTGWRVGEPIT